jgi:hypothetical protein
MSSPNTDSFSSVNPAENITLPAMEAAFADPAIITHGFQFDLQSCEVHDRTPSMAPIPYNDPSQRPDSDELAKALNWYGPVMASGEGRSTSAKVNMAFTIANIRNALIAHEHHDDSALLDLTKTLFGADFPFEAWLTQWESNSETRPLRAHDQHAGGRMSEQPIADRADPRFPDTVKK